MRNPIGNLMKLLLVVLASVLIAQGAIAAQFAGIEKVEPALLRSLVADGEASYLVYLREKADLTGAEDILDSDERGWFVYQSLKEVADRTQAPLLNYLAAQSQAEEAQEVKSFFSVNAIGVASNLTTLQGLASSDAVELIRSLPTVSIPEPEKAVAVPNIAGVEWGVERVRAPEVWAKGMRGQGIVVASIDTGAQFDHPALVNQYRGNQGGGFDHNYNWWDPSNICNPSTVPCDNNGHGTHVTGTMVGDDGGTNQIGVAPQAQWISCKGCETSSCSAFALLECADFILAPWDLNKQNPDPAKRPHVVNNSWGGGQGDPWYRSAVQSWIDSGIFPSFANHNYGPGCGTVRTPADYPESFGSGASDISDNIASFSGRGPSLFGVTKPDITAPGVSIRSSVPNNSYTFMSGTSMATPHTSGVVALLWSYYPGLRRDIPSTVKKLRPATEMKNTTQGCGGDGPTDHPNNVYGWGIADVFQAYTPFNVYTDRSVYNSGDKMDVFLSLVNPFDSSKFVDMYVALRVPGGDLLFFPGFGTNPVPFQSNFEIEPLKEVFDFKMFSHTFNGEATGVYRWYSVFTPPGADIFDPANRLTLDSAPFQKQ